MQVMRDVHGGLMYPLLQRLVRQQGVAAPASC
jgi:hypothetical protein